MHSSINSISSLVSVLLCNTSSAWLKCELVCFREFYYFFNDETHSCKLCHDCDDQVLVARCKKAPALGGVKGGVRKEMRLHSSADLWSVFHPVLASLQLLHTVSSGSIWAYIVLKKSLVTTWTNLILCCKLSECCQFDLPVALKIDCIGESQTGSHPCVVLCRSLHISPIGIVSSGFNLPRKYCERSAHVDCRAWS